MPVLRVSQFAWNKVTKIANELGCSLSYALDKLIDEYEEEIRNLKAELDKTRNYRVLDPITIRRALRGTYARSQRELIDALYKQGYKVVKMGAGG